jgi:hypothetical protein
LRAIPKLIPDKQWNLGVGGPPATRDGGSACGEARMFIFTKWPPLMIDNMANLISCGKVGTRDFNGDVAMELWVRHAIHLADFVNAFSD